MINEFRFHFVIFCSLCWEEAKKDTLRGQISKPKIDSNVIVEKFIISSHVLDGFLSLHVNND